MLRDLKLGRGRPALPYADARLLSVLSHTLWFLPNVASCHAMKNLLEQRQNTFYRDYRVNVCAGPAAGIGLDALKPVRDSMERPLESKTITLSCGKLTTGVTVQPWTRGHSPVAAAPDIKDLVLEEGKPLTFKASFEVVPPFDPGDLAAIQAHFDANPLVPPTPATLLAGAVDPQVLDKGKARFARSCAPCHGEQGQGLIGPNLTDDRWIHGGQVEQVFQSVAKGWPAKGMPPWGRAVPPDELAALVSYVRSLQGTSPPNAKAAEGEPVAPEPLPRS